MWWEPGHNFYNIKDFLVDWGLDLSGWHLTVAEAVADDGVTIVGWGRDPMGHDRAWMATLPAPIPAPGALLLGGLGLTLVSWMRRRRTI